MAMKKSPVSPADLVKATNVLIIDSENDGVTQEGDWTAVAHRDASHLTYIYSETPGDYLEFSFKGTGLWLRVFLSADAGQANISVDGGDPVTIDLYASTTMLHTPFVHSNLAPGEEHTVKIEVDNEKNASSSGYKVAVDAFIVELSKGAMQIWAMIETAITTVTELAKYGDVSPDIDLSRSLGDTTHRWLNAYIKYIMLGSGNILLDDVPDTDHIAVGITATATVGEAVSVGDILYLKSDGKWYKADADATTTMPGAALATEAGSANDSIDLLFYGFFRDDTWAYTIGGLLYVSTTPGPPTQTAPSGTGDQVQVLGLAITADVILFNPSYELVEVA